jgi:Na+/H+ antiporter NhaD/arsenite permease-like protein
VLVVCLAALVGTGLVYLLLRRKITRWWAYCLCAAIAGVFPGLFYIIAMPRDDWARAPDAWSALFAAMMVVGFV